MKGCYYYGQEDNVKVLFALHDLGFADHISIAHLSAIARQSGHKTYFTLLDKFPEAQRELKPDIVAYSANILGYKRIVEANTIARRERQFISIMGGAQPTFSPETFPASGMDAYCVGEGDYAFRDFLDNIGDFNSVDNLLTRLKKNPIRPLINNLDDLPPADRGLILGHSFLKNASKKTFYATRGCPFNCAYCCNNYYHQLYKGQPPVRRFSVERLIREMEDVRSRYRMDFVKLGDDCFTIKADEWLEEFANKYSQRIGIPFNCYLRVDTIDDGMLGLLRKAGCFSVTLSVDSTSPYIREHILHRRMRAENVVERLRKVREYGINTLVNYMLAVPESTLQDDLDTIKQAREANITWMNYTTTVPMDKTELYNYCVAHELLNPLTYEGDMGGCMERSELSCFTEKERDIRFNIFLLGEWIAKLPPMLGNIVSYLIRVIPPNRLFRMFNAMRFRWYMEHKIFEVSDNFSVPRFWQRDENEKSKHNLD